MELTCRALSVGVVARRSGIAVSALRYYDQLGLLGEIPRKSGVRQFPSTVLRRLALIRAAQEAGFTLAEIKLLLDQRPDANVRQQWAALATRRLPELDAMIDRLTRLRATVADCLSCGCLSTCAMLTAQRWSERGKSALFLSAFASLADPTSRAYYDPPGACDRRDKSGVSPG